MRMARPRGFVLRAAVVRQGLNYDNVGELLEQIEDSHK
jgi:hypothetical protein